MTLFGKDYFVYLNQIISFPTQDDFVDVEYIFLRQMVNSGHYIFAGLSGLTNIVHNKFILFPFSNNSITSTLKKTVKPVFNDHPCNTKKVAVVDRWPLFRGQLCNESFKWDLKMEVFIDRWLLAQV